MKLKLPDLNGRVIVIKSDQHEAKKCYENSLKTKRGVFMVVERPPSADTPMEVEPVEETVPVGETPVEAVPTEEMPEEAVSMEETLGRHRSWRKRLLRRRLERRVAEAYLAQRALTIGNPSRSRTWLRGRSVVRLSN